jgi:hypothetical protein
VVVSPAISAIEALSVQQKLTEQRVLSAQLIDGATAALGADAHGDAIVGNAVAKPRVSRSASTCLSSAPAGGARAADHAREPRLSTA